MFKKGNEKGNRIILFNFMYKSRLLNVKKLIQAIKNYIKF